VRFACQPSLGVILVTMIPSLPSHPAPPKPERCLPTCSWNCVGRCATCPVQQGSAEWPRVDIHGRRIAETG